MVKPDALVPVDGAATGKVCSPCGNTGGEIMDFKQFYLSAQGRVNRKQWWLKLVLPVFVISIILAFVDMATGHFDPQNGVGLFSSIFGLAVLIPAILVYIKRFHDRDKSGWWILGSFRSSARFGCSSSLASSPARPGQIGSGRRRRTEVRQQVKAEARR